MRLIHKIVSANAALGTGIFISKFAQPRKRRTLQPGLYIRAAAASDKRCYINLASSGT